MRESRRSRSKLTTFQSLVLAFLLLLPAAAIVKLLLVEVIPWRVGLFLFVFLVVMWGFAFYTTWRDKRFAQNGDWRVSEFHLHCLEVLGGWPAAFVAQRWFRHKTSKKSYQFAFWLIILIHQLIALDYLFLGPITQKIRPLISTLFSLVEG